MIERTLTQLLAAPVSHARSREMGQLGYMQWLGGLPGDADYQAEAAFAYMKALPLKGSHPAVAVFCDILRQSLRTPLAPLDLALPKPRRRGGAKERRSAL